MHRDSNALQRSTSAKSATNMVNFPVYATKRRLRCIIRTVAEMPKCTNYMQAQCMHKTVLIIVNPQSPALMSPFFLQLQVQSNQAEGKQIPNPIHLKMNLIYCLKLHCTRNMYLQAWLDPCADVNIMPASAYQLVFKDLEMRKIKPCTVKNITYTADTVKIIGSCPFCIVHPDAKKLVPVTFYVANNDGGMLLSCKTTLALHLIQPWSRLDYLPPGASLITSTMDNPKKRKLTSLKVHQSKQEMSAQGNEKESQVATSASIKTVQKSNPNIMITTKEQILSNYPGIFEGICKFTGLLYHIQVDPNVSLKQTPCCPVPIHLKESFKKEIDRMLQIGITKPVKEATPWINSFVLVEGKDKSSNPKLCICLDSMNVNKAIICKLYHFKTPENIALLIVNSCVMTVCNCKKGYWHQDLDEA